MKKLIMLPMMACLMTAGLFTSCKKSSTTTPAAPGGGGSTSSSSPSPTLGDVDGGLISLKIDVTTSVMGVPYTISTETAVATFFTATGNNSSFVDGGAVSVNTYSLDKQTNNSYTKTATVGTTPSDLNFASGSAWSVAGAGSVPAFTHTDNATFPTFTGTVPDSINRSAGVTISLGGLTTNADSVILFVAQGTKSVFHTVSGSATSVTLSASDLSTLSAVTDKTAILEVVPYRLSVSTQGGKRYAFVKELAVEKNINIQ